MSVSSLSWRNSLAWFVLSAFVVVLIGGWIHQALQRPFSAIGALVLVLALVWYWSSEDTQGESTSFFHQHSEFEVVFWSVIAFFCAVILFVLPDSPLLSVLQYSRSRLVSAVEEEGGRLLSVGWSLVLAGVVGYATLNIVRARHKEELLNKPEVFLRRLSSGLLATSSPARRANVKETLEILSTVSEELDHEYLPGSIARFMRYSKKLLAEARIVRIFKEAGIPADEDDDNPGFTVEEYSYIIIKCDLALILYKIKDHSVAAHRTQLIKLLSEQRLSLLTVAAKALVLHCLQQLKMSSSRLVMERAVVNIIISCFGHELTELKAITDSKGNYHSLHKLVFHDIKALQSRRAITDHMLRESKLIQTAERVGVRPMTPQDNNMTRYFVPKSRSLPLIDTIDDSQMGPGSPVSSAVRGGCVEYGRVRSNPYVFSDGSSRRLIQAKTKIVSDIDDTFICSGGSYPAGLDATFPKRTVYPGVGAFYRELDLSGSGDLNSPLQVRGWYEDSADLLLGNLVFLSARPHIYKDVVESQEYKKYRSWRQQGYLHCLPMLLPGSLVEGSDFVLMGKLESLAENKFNNLRDYALLYPEYSYVFIGDNGQADVRALSRLLDVSFINIKMAYIHKVQAEELTFGLPSEDQWKMSKIFFFDNYVQAALHAFKNLLLSAPGLCRVVIAAVNDFDSLPESSRNAVSKESLTNAIKEVLAYLDWCLSGPSDTRPVWTLEITAAVKSLIEAIKLPDGHQQLALPQPPLTNDSISQQPS